MAFPAQQYPGLLINISFIFDLLSFAENVNTADIDCVLFPSPRTQVEELRKETETLHSELQQLSKQVKNTS